MPVLAAATSAKAEQLVRCTPQPNGSLICRIDEPNVRQQLTPYPQIRFQPGDNVIEITASDKNQMSFGRPGRFPRGLTHLGSYEFVPMGAEHVRVRFADAAGAMTLTVHDPDVVLTAKKTA